MNLARLGSPLPRAWALIRRSVLGTDQLAWAALSTGVLLRVAQYLADRSLWLDEAMLALNIIRRSWAGLLLPLDYHQGAPIGFLWLVKAATLVLGQSELALRLVPLLCALAALPLFYWLAREHLEPEAAVLALALFALVDPLVAFASEVKQYSSDVTVALVLLLAGTRYQRLRPTASHGLLLGLLGATAVWLSHPASFVLAGTGLVLAWPVLRRRNWRALGPLCLAGGLWAVSFAGEYLVSLRWLGHDAALLRFWAAGMMPLPPLKVSWFLDRFFGLFEYPVGLPLAGLGALTFLAGVLDLARRNRGALALLLAPLGAALLASALHKYPFAGRLLLFVVPMVLIVVAAGAIYVRSLASSALAVGVLVVGLLLLHPLYLASYHLVHPRTIEEARPVLAYLREHWQPGDVIYLDYPSSFAFEYYAPRFGFRAGDYVVGAESDDWRVLLDDVDLERGQPRVWLVFLHIQKPDTTVATYLAYLDHIGHQRAAFQAPGSAVYLYDLAGSQSRVARLTAAHQERPNL